MRWKKIICFGLCAFLFIGCGTQQMEQKEAAEKRQAKKANEKAELKNPSISDEGNVTWDCIYFGNYVQESMETNKTPVKWRVLSIDGNNAFLLSDQILELIKYNEGEPENLTWHTCSLRSWLNNEFVDETFSEKEQNSILESTVDNTIDDELKEAFPYTEWWDETPTKDKVFCLSVEEVKNEAYGFPDTIKSSGIRKAEDTEYVKSAEKMDEIDNYEKGVQPLLRNSWWLRTMGVGISYKEDGSVVYGDGSIEWTGALIGELVGVRPALHLDISDDSVWTYAGSETSE